ncbi:MAG: efflux RND transporter periplasmic adaptor subunit [Ginsengibacter sp.]|jgi:Cu(I)/Ag(I) efflux system membrane fusion protein
MKTQLYLFKLLLVIIALPIIFTACAEKQKTVAVGEKVQTYTCPMHPQVVKDAPGSCPFCGMDLVPFDKNDDQPFLTLGASQRALANVTTMTVGENDFSKYTRLNGRLTTDPEQTMYVSSRVAGRIEVLYVKETGVTVRKGQALYKIYSEQLSTLQQEYLLAKAQIDNFPDDQRFRQIEKGARQKLLLYGQTEAQLKDLVAGQNVSPFVTYYAPNSGVVSELSVAEGQYVSEGGTIMKLENYTNLWVEADVYPSDLNKVKTGEKVTVIIAGYENQPVEMKISFINPVLGAGSQTMQIRGSIANPNHQWQSGLQASVLLPSPGQKTALTLPVDAVLRDGQGTHIWVERKEGEYEPRMVTVGRETFSNVEITSGLKEGEKVVVSGAYLLYSEFTLKKGKDPMAGMKM